MEEAGHGYVALDVGPTGKLLKPLGDLDFEDAVSLYKEVVAYGVKAGADLVFIATMSDSYELKAAVLAAKEAGVDPVTGENIPVFTSVTFDEKASHRRKCGIHGGAVRRPAGGCPGNQLRTGTGADEGDP